MTGAVKRGRALAWLLSAMASAAIAQETYLDDAVVESVQVLQRPGLAVGGGVSCSPRAPDAANSPPWPGFLRDRRPGSSLSQNIRWLATEAASAGECPTAEKRVEGNLYLVRYRYQGQVYQVRMPTHPGASLKVRVMLSTDPETTRASGLR